MGPPSYSSSLEPLVGSAPSNSGRSPRPSTRESRHPRSTTSHRHSRRHSHSHRPPAGASNNMNGGSAGYVDTDVNGAAYSSASTYAISPTYQPIPVGSDTYAYQSQYYYTPTQTNYNSYYDPVLTIDEEQPQTSTAQSQQQRYSSYVGGNQYVQNTAQWIYRPQTPTAPTALSWSVESCVEERIRLGLSRYATEEEVEQARRALHDVTSRADASGQSGRH